MPGYRAFGRLKNYRSIVISVIGITLSIFYYFKSKKEKKPLYDLNTTFVLYSFQYLPDIEIKYKGQTVEKLQLTRLSFWNGGKDAIRKNDLSSNNPIVITFDERIIIYNIEINYQLVENNFKAIQISQNKILLEFDFLNYNDGAVINIYHNGVWNKKPEINGTIIGSKNIVKIKDSEEHIDIINKFLSPIAYCFNNKKIIFKIIGALLTLPFILLSLLLMMLLTPFIFYSVIKKSFYKKQFILTK